MDKKGRVLVAVSGLDSHSRGALVVTQALRDAGLEVIYTGVRQTPEEIVNAAIQEGVDVIGVSMHSGTHLTIMPRIMELLKENKADNTQVVFGGIIPGEDVPVLKEAGVREVFGPGADTKKIAQFVKGIIN